MATLTIFANFRINDEERLQRLKDSFQSFKDIDAQRWVINVRGRYKWEVLFYLHDRLGEKLVPYMLESRWGWFHDSRQMLKDISSDYVLFWVEDHINMVPAERYAEILKEMKQSAADFLLYSWFTQEMKDRYAGIAKAESTNIWTFEMNRANHQRVQRNRPGSFLISMIGIFSRPLFGKLIATTHPLLRRWPKECPFDFEKRSFDTSWLPFRQALPKYELFASIDTDHGYPREKCCLHSRGLYPRRVTRAQEKAEVKLKPRGLELAYQLLIPRLLRDFFRRLSYHW